MLPGFELWIEFRKRLGETWTVTYRAVARPLPSYVACLGTMRFVTSYIFSPRQLWWLGPVVTALCPRFLNSLPNVGFVTSECFPTRTPLEEALGAFSSSLSIYRVEPINASNTAL